MVGTKQEHPIHVTLKVEETRLFGGDILKGIVSLHIDQSGELKKKELLSHWKSLNLELEGYENVVIVRENNQGGDQGRRFNKYQSKQRFVCLTIPLVSSWEKEESEEDEEELEGGGHCDKLIYNYPFEWELPSHLPASFLSTRNDRQPRFNESYCMLDYTLHAHLQPKDASRLSIVSDPGVTTKVSSRAVLLYMKAKPRRLQAINGHTIEESQHPLHLFGWPCFTVLGHIMLGFGCDRHIVRPNTIVTVDIFGRNLSRMKIQRLQVQWIEHVQWNVKSREYNLKNVLAEVIIDEDGLGEDWVAQPKSVTESCCGCGRFCVCWGRSASGGKDHHQPLSRDEESSTADGRSRVTESFLSNLSYPQKELQLLVPKHARYSYEGRMMQVRHELVVKVETPGGCLIPSPSASCPTYVRPLLDEHHGDDIFLMARKLSIPKNENSSSSSTENTGDDKVKTPVPVKRLKEQVLISTTDDGGLPRYQTTINVPTIHLPFESKSSVSAPQVSLPILGSRLHPTRMINVTAEQEKEEAYNEAPVASKDTGGSP